MNAIEKSCHVTEAAQQITGFSGSRSEKSNLFCFSSYRLVKVVLLLLLELAYLVGRNVCPWGIHHSNPSVRCTGEQLVPGRTNIGGNLFLFFLCFLFFPSLSHGLGLGLGLGLFFIRLLLLSLIEKKNSTKDCAVFIFSERWCSSSRVYCRLVYRLCHERNYLTHCT